MLSRIQDLRRVAAEVKERATSAGRVFSSAL